MKTTLIKQENGYNFWRLTTENGKTLWNITPEGQEAPVGGYRNRNYVEAIKHQYFEGKKTLAERMG